MKKVVRRDTVERYFVVEALESLVASSDDKLDAKHLPAKISVASRTSALNRLLVLASIA